jgi:hypothetical protein
MASGIRRMRRIFECARKMGTTMFYATILDRILGPSMVSVLLGASPIHPRNE